MHRYALPASIVIGSALMGLGLSHGLQSKEPEPRAIAAPSSAAPPETVSADDPGITAPPPDAFVAASPPGSHAELVARVTRDAAKALAAVRPRLVAACWTPHVAQRPEPGSMRVTYVVSFDPRGKENARGMNEDREVVPEVAQCLNAQSFSLSVPPPGSQVTVELPFTLP